MPNWQRYYVISCSALIAALLLACACHFGGWPRLVYQPYAREWQFAVDADGVAMVYPGIALWAVAGGILGAITAAVGTRIIRRGISSRSLRLLGAWTLTASGLTGAYFTWSIWP